MATQIEELQLVGRYMRWVKKIGVVSLVAGSVSAFAFYVGVERRRYQMMEDFRKSCTPEMLAERTERMQKFGMMHGPIPPYNELQNFKHVQEGSISDKRIATYEYEINGLPKAKQVLAKNAREAYLMENLPKAVNCMKVMEEEKEKLGSGIITPKLLEESPSFKAAVEAMQAEKSALNVEAISAGLKNKIESAIGEKLFD